ncbi:MAG: glycosyltransferase family 2 protein [Crenarchaeota archaeon]|nr:MAG: glycosyltransferase family 2 protein [Thermoproteota archaeon]RDJ33321.1 MAG: glycosyltransferase family 2 protein [Thermoproteota archaeon]RDJ36176.1 MAG: glycosyltransferase family 2 protein [Thermoproteota archaeon]RDJ38807.1 MAG: glycosyltransferase family 2 protein [Thermoproteota archaeon]
MNPKISIIILNYNAGDLLLNCVESVFKTNYENYEVIVVDNLSIDKSHIRCKEEFPQICLIENKKNYGYCEGNNIGIRNAKGDFIVILNPDTIVDENWLNELITAYDKFGSGLYQPKILSLYEKDILQSTGNLLHIFGFGFARDKGIKDFDKRKQVEKIGYASGTCLFTSAKILDELDLFDEFLFLYHDDLDLGWRAAQLGIPSFYVPKSMVFHAESYSLKWSARKFYWLERNRKYCLLTRYSKETYKKIRLALILVEVLVWAYYCSKGFFITKLKVEIFIFKNKKIIAEKYFEIEKKKIISDKELIKNFPDEIFVPENVMPGLLNKGFNSIISKLSRIAKKSVLVDD